MFAPLPPQRGSLPIWIGGRTEPALRRCGRLADGYHASQASPDEYETRIPVLERAAADAGRERPMLSARVRVHFGTLDAAPVARFGPQLTAGYTMAGTQEQMLREVERFERIGVTHLALAFDGADAENVRSLVERFDREVASQLRGARSDTGGR